MKKIVIILLIITAIACLILVLGSLIFKFRFKSEVKKLFLSSKKISGKVFSYDQLNGLPDPVQRYFRNVLKEGQPYISYARLKHDGQFKIDLKKDWVNIQGEEYFTAQKPGFVWKGEVPFAVGCDMYINGNGRLVVKLLSIIKVVDGKGEKYDQGELLRWLTESVMIPTALLPNENLKWIPINSESAELNYVYNGISLSCLVFINDKGEITGFEARRYMNETTLEKWTPRCSDYKEVDGIKVPTKFEAIWSLESGDYSYAKFNVKEIEFNKPEKY